MFRFLTATMDDSVTMLTLCVSLLIIITNTVFAVNIARVRKQSRDAPNFLLQLVCASIIDVLCGVSLMALSIVSGHVADKTECIGVVSFVASCKIMSQINLLCICGQQNYIARKLRHNRAMQYQRKPCRIVTHVTILAVVGVVCFVIVLVQGHAVVPLSARNHLIMCHIGDIFITSSRTSLIGFLVANIVLTFASNTVCLSSVWLLKKSSVDIASHFTLSRQSCRPSSTQPTASTSMIDSGIQTPIYNHRQKVKLKHSHISSVSQIISMMYVKSYENSPGKESSYCNTMMGKAKINSGPQTVEESKCHSVIDDTFIDTVDEKETARRLRYSRDSLVTVGDNTRDVSTRMSFKTTPVKQQRAVVTISLILVSLNIATIPMLVMASVKLLHQVTIPDKLQWLIVLLTYVNTICNPLIYTARMKDLRKLLSTDISKMVLKLRECTSKCKHLGDY